jgi:glycerophosphoryl diester phosphodiesterase
MLAFDKAAALGVTGFETDLRLSADSEIILAHDENLVRLGLPEFNISKMTRAQIERLEFGSPDGKYRHCIASLETLLQKYPEKDYIFDCKINDRRLLLLLRELLGQLSFHNRIWFLTWSREMDEQVRNLFPDFKLFPREPVIRRWGFACLAGIGSLFEPPNELLALPAFYHSIPLIREKMIRDLHKRNKQFLGYLVNNHADFRRCMDCNADAVLTDRPDIARALILQPD